MVEDIKNILIPVIMIIVVIIIGIGALFLIDNYQCSTYQEMTGRNTEYKAMTCYIDNNGIKVPYREYLALYTATGNSKE